jgi:hypothetical protein
MKFNIFLILIALILLFIIFNMIHYLVRENYIIECFNSTHTVNLPLNSKYSCKNFCGPTSRCAITGQQCFTDIDCPGCQSDSSELSKTKDCIPGNDDAGKLTVGVTPTYSSLTTGYGSREKIITKDMYDRPPQANFGYDDWSDSFNEGQQLFNKRYKPNQLQYMPNYPPMYSITGQFISDGPLPSNY